MLRDAFGPGRHSAAARSAGCSAQVTHGASTSSGPPCVAYLSNTAGGCYSSSGENPKTLLQLCPCQLLHSLRTAKFTHFGGHTGTERVVWGSSAGISCSQNHGLLRFSVAMGYRTALCRTPAAPYFCEAPVCALHSTLLKHVDTSTVAQSDWTDRIAGAVRSQHLLSESQRQQQQLQQCMQ